jgi:hypothetical protein
MFNQHHDYWLHSDGAIRNPINLDVKLTQERLDLEA